MLLIPSTCWRPNPLPRTYILAISALCGYFLIDWCHLERFKKTREDYSKLPFTSRQGPHATPQKLLNIPVGSTGSQQPTSVAKFPQTKTKVFSSNDTRSFSTQRPIKDIHEYINQTSPVVTPWPNDDDCKNYSIRFANRGTFKPRALVSFPGSGNTWLRYLLEGSTGIFTGSQYRDEDLIAQGLLGEARDPREGNTIVQKTHHSAFYFQPNLGLPREERLNNNTEEIFNYSGILVIRSPYDALWSYWNFLQTRDHRAVAEATKFNMTQWEDFVVKGTTAWVKLIEKWVQNSADLLIVKYEELVADPRTQIIRILKYLGLPVNEGRLQCVLKHIEGPFHRRGSKNALKKIRNLAKANVFHSKLDRIVKDGIKRITNAFKKYHIPVVLNYTFRIAKY